MTERLDDPQRADKASEPTPRTDAAVRSINAARKEGWDVAIGSINDLAELSRDLERELSTARSAVVASTQDELRAKYKASSPEDRQRLIHEHDCPRVWDFWRKHSSGSKLCPSCLMCGQQSFDRADWAITHLELPDIYICKVCVDKTRTPQSASERTAWTPAEDGQPFISGRRMIELWSASTHIAAIHDMACGDKVPGWATHWRYFEPPEKATDSPADSRANPK